MAGQDSASGIKKTHPEELTPDERAYYRDTWGFDPVADKKIPGPKMGGGILYYYETVIPLENDPELKVSGVIMHARVNMAQSGQSHNRIVFTRGEKSAVVECVHTAVYAAPACEISDLPEGKLKELATTTRGKRAILPPWEHFAALKSFAGGIAAVGLLWLLDPFPQCERHNGERNSSDLPLPKGLIAQIHGAIFELVPEFLEVLDFDALLALGTLQFNDGSMSRAIDYLEYATRLNPASVDAMYSLGLAYHGSQNYPQAVRAFERVIALDPTHAEAWISLSAARSFNGDDYGCKEAMRRWKILTGSQWPPNL